MIAVTRDRIARAVCCLVLGSSAAGWAQSPQVTTQTDAVRQVLDEQVQAWNAGDIDAFMAHYWQSDQLTFSSGGQTTRGWQATHDRYRKRYPDRSAMGQLSFHDLEVHPLGDDACFVLGRWSLQRQDDQPSGNFTLILRNRNGRWQIVHDHTSVLEETR